MKKFVTAFLAGLMVIGCAKAPMTGRSQLILIEPSQEMQLGLSESEKIRASAKLSSDKALTERIERIGKRIAAVSGDFDYEWKFFVIEDDTLNAFALPGGHVYFYTGILKLMENDDQIATVMGHEIAHVIARHGAERMSLQIVNNLGAQVLATAVEVPDKYQQLYGLAYGAATNVGVMLPYSRSHESEADTIGLYLMHAAGYDPQQAVRFWQRMQQASQGNGTPEFLSTHLSDAKRIENIRKNIKLLPKRDETGLKKDTGR